MRPFGKTTATLWTDIGSGPVRTTCYRGHELWLSPALPVGRTWPLRGGKKNCSWDFVDKVIAEAERPIDRIEVHPHIIVVIYKSDGTKMTDVYVWGDADLSSKTISVPSTQW